MRSAKTLMATAALLAAASTPALAEWQWVEPDTRTETRTEIYEERQVPSYQQPTYYEERRYVEPIVTNREVFVDGPCEVTRTSMSDGTATDERRCAAAPSYQIVPPHRLIIDRIGRHFDRLRGY